MGSKLNSECSETVWHSESDIIKSDSILSILVVLGAFVLIQPCYPSYCEKKKDIKPIILLNLW